MFHLKHSCELKRNTHTRTKPLCDQPFIDTCGPCPKTKMKHIVKYLFLTAALCVTAFSQVPTTTAIQILKAEDARRYDAVLEKLLSSPNAAIRERAALAVGRIGDDKAIPALTALLEKDQSEQVRVMAAFAIGEIESAKGSDVILKTLKDPKTADEVRARAVEAAGKIAAANAKDAKSKDLGEAILETIGSEDDNGVKPSHDTVLLGITAVLRARPANGDAILARYLKSADASIRADAANTLSRIRATNANSALHAILIRDADPDARANAAKALGAAVDVGAFDLLLNSALTDTDSRVRVSAIRSLVSIKAVKAADKLVERGEKLLVDSKRSKFAHPAEKNEMIEIATVLGRLLAGTGDTRAVKFLDEFAILDDARTPEISVARIRVKPGEFDNSTHKNLSWHQLVNAAQATAEMATIEPKNDDVKKMKAGAPGLLKEAVEDINGGGADKKSIYAWPEYLRAYARFKPADLDEVLRASLGNSDVQVRAAAAGLLDNQPVSKENVEALKKAFDLALVRDKYDNDAQLSILDALYKLNKKESVGTLLVALNAADYLVRKKAFELLADKNLQKEFPGISTSLQIARSKHKDQVLPYSAVFGTKLGQVLNTDTDYRRALSRKNGSVKAVLTTEKGVFTIVFTPEEAPLTVDNFIKLARANYFNGLEVHRVVPNFVMQDGDPRGDGNGGPGWSIRCEINILPYDRGAVGMALSGKDTGGSQWFVTHAPQPHLDGGYTVFGHVNETDMKVVDSIVRGDKIISAKIVEGNLPQRSPRKR